MSSIKEPVTKGALRWKNLEYREKVREYARNRYAADPEFKRQRLQNSRNCRLAKCQDPEYRAARAAKTRAYREAKRASRAQPADCTP